MKNSVCIVLSGHTFHESATLMDIDGCFQFAKCSRNIRNNKTRSVKISPTGLQLIGHFVRKNRNLLLHMLGMFFTKSLFYTLILQTNKQTDETIFSFFLQAKQWRNHLHFTYLG